MATVLDTNRNCTAAASCLAANGFQTVIRYYSQFTKQKEKRLTPQEAVALGRAGLRLGAVYQDAATSEEAFTASKGLAAGRYAYRYAQDVIHQPPGSAIYFSVDFDATKSMVTNSILPFFRAVAAGFDAESGAAPDYRIGVYGSGLVCDSLLTKNAAALAWVSQSKGFAGTKQFLQTQRWALSQNLPSVVCGLDCDTNERNPSQQDIGDFAPDLAVLGAAPGATLDQRMRVIARGGLLLRSGPGTDFARVQTLPFDTEVFALERRGEWVMVDLQGDGKADGFCFGAFLAPR